MLFVVDPDDLFKNKICIISRLSESAMGCKVNAQNKDSEYVAAVKE
jgi:hypothetical protein